jgi:hypothetical protein
MKLMIARTNRTAKAHKKLLMMRLISDFSVYACCLRVEPWIKNRPKRPRTPRGDLPLSSARIEGWRSCLHE